MVVICLMPLFGKWNLGHRFNLGILFSLLAGAALLHWLAINEDSNSEHHQHALHDAKEKAERAVILAGSPAGIPSSGAVTLLQNDPKIQGARLFAKHCASCHRYDGHDGTGHGLTEKILLREGDDLDSIASKYDMSSEEILTKNQLARDDLKPGTQLVVNFRQTAPDLYKFASREWIAEILEYKNYTDKKYFGNTAFSSGKMAKYLKDFHPEPDDKETAEQNAIDFPKIAAALSAQAQLPYQKVADQEDADLIAEGEELIVEEFACIDCHQYVEPDDQASAPDLTGYGSKEWLTAIIVDPSHDRFYGKKNDRMPSFGRDNKLTGREIGLIVDWLRQDYYEPSGKTASTGH